LKFSQCEVGRCDLETGVRRHSRSPKAALLDRAHTTLYSSSIVTVPLSITVSEIAAYWSNIATQPSDLQTDGRTYGQTDGIGVAYRDAL